MNKNMKRLLNILLQQSGYMTSGELASLLDVTERSIRNYVRTLNRSNAREPLIISSPQGYKIQKDIYDQSVKDQLMEQDESSLLFRVANILMSNEGYMTFDALAAQLHYSVESIRSKVQLLFARIKEVNIKVHLDSQIFTGIKLEGSETQKRLLLEQLVPVQKVTRQHPKHAIQQMLNGIATEEQVRQQIEIVDEVLAKQHVTMDFVVYVKIICHMLIIEYRRGEGYSVLPAKDPDRVERAPERVLAKSLLNAREVKIVDSGEEYSLTNYLISLPMNIPGTFTPEMNRKQEKAINDSLKSAEKVYSIPLYSNGQYRTQIMNHIMRLLNPLEESIPIFNPYSTETKREYLFAYSIACYLYDTLQNDLDIRIPESEISFLAIHIQLILTEETKNTISTALIFRGKRSEADLFRYKIQNYFPNIKVEKTLLSDEQWPMSKYQLIIACGFDGAETDERNVIKVSRELNPKEIVSLQRFVDSYGTFSLINDLDYYHIDEHSSRSAIKELIGMSGYSELLPYFMQRESMSPTDIGNLVALPHPFLKGSETSAKIIVGINDEDIDWGSQKVRLIIIYIPAADLKTNKDFFSDVYQRTSNISLIRSLIGTKTKDEFVKIWNKKGEN
ncbi:BglG family transcription antiterminator [Lacticaseibacillus hegangensis]|uniref:BglG family transcription antiterminator n=1 Tax=Lacticaseibacillus hegangensis TaxID=2486010 RepID=A0ABW4D1P7_9LACO|nr:PRD domain-containing protein [Lacticaseibacillus hegangensis]